MYNLTPFLFTVKFSSLSTQELEALLEKQAEKEFKKATDKRLKKWKEEKSEILHYMMKKEVEIAEANFETAKNTLTEEWTKLMEHLRTNTK